MLFKYLFSWDKSKYPKNMRLYLWSLSYGSLRKCCFSFLKYYVCISASLFCGSSASSDLQLSSMLPLVSACQMCSSPCCT